MGPPFAGPWTFKYHPWVKAIHDSDAEMIIGQKGAQLGYTETCLNRTFYEIDIKGGSVLYVLPATTPDAGNFSAARFDGALELSPHLEKLFSDVKNIGHKRAGSANLYIRGSRSRSQLKSIPVSLTILDEVDEMVQENITLALERMAGQMHRQALLVSTPTVPGFGINAYYLESDQRTFFFRCPSCNRMISLEYPDSLIITADDAHDTRINNTHIICIRCKNILPHEGKTEYFTGGEWVPEFTNRNSEGYCVSQLYSCLRTPKDFVLEYFKSLLDPTEEQNFWNNKVGQPHVVQGARITDIDIESCIKTYTQVEKYQVASITTMGVDIGTKIHVEIDEWLKANNDIDVHMASQCRVLKMCIVDNFEELDALMKNFLVNYCVIDANPERRKALEFAQRFWGIVKLCFYARGIKGKQINIHADDEHTLSVDRTSWLDLSLGRFKRQTILLPADTTYEYKQHIKAPIRIYQKDGDGNPIGKYVTGKTQHDSKADKSIRTQDHYAHARNYSEIALTLSVSKIENRDIISPWSQE